MITLVLRDGKFVVEQPKEKLLTDTPVVAPIVAPTVDKSTDQSPQVQMVQWAVDNNLITEDMNLVKSLNDCGWTTLDQMKSFVKADIPADIPLRFHTRLLKAVGKLLNVEKEDETEPTEVQVVVLNVKVIRVYVKPMFHSPQN